MRTADGPPSPVAFLSHTLPPDGGGQAIVLGRLLGGLDASACCFVASDRRGKAVGGAVRTVPTPWLLRKMRKVGALQTTAFAGLVASRARAVARLLRRDRCTAIVGCTGGDLADVPSAVAAARIVGIPAFLYYFDDYRHQWRTRDLMWKPRTAAVLCERVEAAALAGAAGIIVPNESLAEDVRLRTDVPVVIVRNPVDTAAYAAGRGTHKRGPAAAWRVVYTGAVYEAQAAALATVARAVEVLRMNGRPVELHVYTPDPPARLLAQGIPGSVTVHPAVAVGDAAAVQMAADILLLPLSFSSSYPELIRTSAPGKLGEYLAAGRPMLVHGPPDSFPVAFAARHDCAAICPVDDVARVASVLDRLRDDRAWADSLATRAVGVSESFAIAVNRARLCEFVGIRAGSRSGAAEETPGR